MSQVTIRFVFYFFQEDSMRINGDPISGYLFKDVVWPYPFLPRAGEAFDAGTIQSQTPGGYLLVETSRPICYKESHISIPVQFAYEQNTTVCGHFFTEDDPVDWIINVLENCCGGWDVFVLNGERLTFEQRREKALRELKAWQRAHREEHSPQP